MRANANDSLERVPMDLQTLERVPRMPMAVTLWSAVPRMQMDLESLECGAYNANGHAIFGARCLEWQWTWNLWSAVPRMPMDLEFLERGA